MKKTLKKFVSLFTCLALLLSVLLYGTPLRSNAASAGHISLRIEGASGQIYSGQAEFQDGQYLYPVLDAVLKANGIHEEDTLDPVYGRYISAIGNDKIDGCWWSIYVNGSASMFGVDSLPLKNGDTIELFYIGSDTLYPQVKLQPQNPVAGQNVTVNVSANATTYDANWNPTITHKNVSGAKVTFDGKTVGSTDANGNLALTMPSQTGTYSLTVSEDQAGSYPLLMRTGNIAVSVGSAPSQPAGGNYNMANNAVSFNVIDNGGQSAAILSASGFHAVSLDGYSRAYQLDIPGNTVISGPQGWNGVFTTPTLISASSLAVPDGDVRMAVEIGVPGQNITLSNYATLTLPLQSGKQAGYFDAAGQFHPIIEKLTTNVAPTDGRDAYYDDTVNNKLIIYTMHFSKFVAYVSASNVSTTDSIVSSAIAGAAGYLQKKETSDWSAFALANAGYPVPSDYLSSVTQTLTGNGGSFDAPVSLAKTVIALRAAGADPTNFDGYNLVEKLYNYNGLDQSTLNSPIYALLALDSGKYTVPGTALWNDQKLISLILGRQNPNGGFSLSKGAASDPDITAMAITALAPHLDDSAVAQAVNAAVAYLSSAQAADGGYVPTGSTSEASESISQVVIALSSAGIDPLTDSRFVKNGKSVLDALMRYKNTDGGFKHAADDAGSDLIATQQALMALEAYTRYEQHGARLYDLSGVNGSVTSANPHTGSDDSDWMILVIPGMLALLAASSRRRRQNY